MKFIRVTRALLAIAILLPASSAFAQQTSSNNHGTAISASYSSLREEQAGFSYWDKGFQADVHQPLGRSIFSLGLGLVGDFSTHHNAFYDDSLKSYLGGVRVTFGSSSMIEPFAQVLIGTEQCCSSSKAFAFQPGAGINVWFMDRIGIRGQVDYRLARYSTSGTSTTYKETRLNIGAVVSLGKR